MAKKKQKKIVSLGVAHVTTSFNNTIVSLGDMLGNTLCWASSGTAGFKGSRKKSPFAAQVVGRTVGNMAANFGMKKIAIIIKGRGNGRESAIRALKASGLSILSVEDKTTIAHNGCRPPKRRRL